MEDKSLFKEYHPDLLFLSADAQEEMLEYLQQRQLLPNGAQIKTFERAGDGNMNIVMRLSTETRSFILKQSRPWVNKYPSIAAPFDRILVEMLFYQLIDKDSDLRHFFPKLLFSDTRNRIMVLEDLGTSADFTHYYKQARSIPPEELEVLVENLAKLHNIATEDTPYAAHLSNEQMRQLNHAHIFQIPFEEQMAPDLNAVTPGLQAVAAIYRNDAELKIKVQRLGETYLANGSSLLHGDYFPGSWINTPNGLYALDPEFGFFGNPAFDLGVMMAHLALTGHAFKPKWEFVKGRYQRIRQTVDEELVFGFAGTEVMRRLMGIAQLPIPNDLGLKSNLLASARQWIMEGPSD